jgi:hypothetical protein
MRGLAIHDSFKVEIGLGSLLLACPKAKQTNLGHSNVIILFVVLTTSQFKHSPTVHDNIHQL